MTFPDYNNEELTATVLLDTLTSEAPALTHEQQEQLFEQVMADYADIPLKADRLKKVKADRYYNGNFRRFWQTHDVPGGDEQRIRTRAIRPGDVLKIELLFY